LYQILGFALILCQVECDAIEMIKVKHGLLAEPSPRCQMFFSRRSHGVILTKRGGSSKQYNVLNT